ncbi:hypothetical protein VP01_1238g2 [Puccinia sorghi]|uniref:Uncharacterized protein n=1 Tax=Puccinia sorghi TaxID=27349 RepID=A0A0L6VPN8_9BASI|nr:hypothetical protein VP01_1238g2 [Puccinia sorghi]
MLHYLEKLIYFFLFSFFWLFHWLNLDFNYRLAKLGIQNEKIIGVLKSCWSSLQEMHLHLSWLSDKQKKIVWLYSCLIIQNMFAPLGNQWMELSSNDNFLPNSMPSNSSSPVCNANVFCENLTQDCGELVNELG